MTQWLTPNCNDYRCLRNGYCVFRRPACLDYLEDVEAVADAEREGEGPDHA
jgi:hypothetical protein